MRYLTRNESFSLTILLAMFLLDFRLGTCQETNQEAITVQVESSVTELSLGSLGAQFNLGMLPSGETVVIQARVHNNSAFDIYFDKIQAFCSCVKVQAFGNTIPADGFLDLKFTIDVPKRVKSAVQSQAIYLEDTSPDSSKMAIQLLLNYEVEGLLCFAEQAVMISTDEAKSECHFDVPILLTNPVRPEGVRVRGIGAMKSLSTSIEKKGASEWRVKCVLSTTEIPPHGIAGQLEISDSELGRVDSIPCVIELEKDLAISPTAIRFIVSDGSDSVDKVYRASAIARIRQSKILPPSTKGENPQENLASFECTPDHGTITVEQKRIGPGIYRIMLECKPELVTVEEGVVNDEIVTNLSGLRKVFPEKLDWRISLGGEVLKASSKVVQPEPR